MPRVKLSLIDKIESEYDIHIPEDKCEEYSDVILELFNRFSRPVEAENINDPIICYLYMVYFTARLIRISIK